MKTKSSNRAMLTFRVNDDLAITCSNPDIMLRYLNMLSIYAWRYAEFHQISEDFDSTPMQFKSEVDAAWLSVYNSMYGGKCHE